MDLEHNFFMSYKVDVHSRLVRPNVWNVDLSILVKK